MRIVVDYDGIICHEDTGELIEKSKEVMNKLKEEGWHITIWTANPTSKIQEMADFMIDNEIPFDEILCNKPRATIYIDDRAVSCWETVELTLDTWEEIENAGGETPRTMHRKV